MYLNRKNRNGLISWQLHQLTLPRFQMSVILLLTGFAGFLSSFLLLHLGVSQMWLRYPLSILSAYAAFLLLLRLWLAFQRYSGDFDLPGNVDFPINNGIDNSISGAEFLGGGDFGGAGAGGSWGDATPSSSESGGSSILDSFSFDFDLEELALVIIAVVALIGGLVASLYIIYIAPILLAEILVDGLLLRGLQNRVKNIEQKHWLQTAIRKTLLPAVLCALFFGVIGGALQAIAPEAKSIGEVWTVLTTPKSTN
jgi:hypothetical protein